MAVTGSKKLDVEQASGHSCGGADWLSGKVEMSITLLQKGSR